MSTHDWHAPTDALARFAIDPRSLDDAMASSIELHVLRCAACRTVVASAANSTGVVASWDAVADRIDAPRPSWAERVLRALGVDDSYARLVGATPALTFAWLAAMVVVVANAALLAVATDSPGPFLVIAPVVPLGSVAIAYAAGRSPVGEAGVAAPLNGFGLALRRAVAVLTVSLVLLTAGALALPGLTLVDAAWVLPALGLSLGALALGTWLRAEVAAGLLAGAWFAAVILARILTPDAVERLAPLTRPGQLLFAVLASGALVIIFARRDTFAFERNV